MHDALFAKQAQWANDAVDTELARLANDLDLDATEFSACLNSRQALERVLPDIYDAISIANETPTFIILYGGSGRVMSGSRSASDFATLLDNMIADASTLEGN